MLGVDISHGTGLKFDRTKAPKYYNAGDIINRKTMFLRVLWKININYYLKENCTVIKQMVKKDHEQSRWMSIRGKLLLHLNLTGWITWHNNWPFQQMIFKLSSMQFSCSTSIINQQTNVSAFVTYLQEAYTLYNRTHNTNHFRIYFPELNPMETGVDWKHLSERGLIAAWLDWRKSWWVLWEKRICLDPEWEYRWEDLTHILLHMKRSSMLWKQIIGQKCAYSTATTVTNELDTRKIV